MVKYLFQVLDHPIYWIQYYRLILFFFYIGKYLFLIEQHWAEYFFSWVLLCPLMLSASTQKFKFSMNFLSPFFSVCLDSLICLLDVIKSGLVPVAVVVVHLPWNFICILSDLYFIRSKYVFYQNLSFIMCLLHIVLRNYMLIIQVSNNLCPFSIEILISPYIMIELENNHKICWYSYWRNYIFKTAITKLFVIGNN